MPVRKGKTGLLLDGVSAVGAGESLQFDSRHATFDVAISGTATAELEVSWDGNTWRDLPGSSKTATAQFSITEWYPYIRGNVTAYTSGTVTITAAVAPD